MLRYISVLLLLSFSQFSFAGITWTIEGVQYNSSALSTCQIYVSQKVSTIYIIKFTSVQSLSSPYSCNYSRTKISTGAFYDNQSALMVKSGSCDSGLFYDPATGSCAAPILPDGQWCEPPTSPGAGKVHIISNGRCVAPSDATLANQCKAYAKAPDSDKSVVTTYRYPESDNEEYRTPKKAASKIGCELQLLEDLSCVTKPAYVDCKTIMPDGSCYSSPKLVQCKTKAVLTGNVAPDPFGTPSGSKCSGDECTLEPPEEIKEEKPCTYVYDAEGRKSCDSWTFTGKEGAEQCGTVGGVFSCKNDLPKATGKGLSISTNISEEPQPDGGKKITKTDTAKQVTCVGTKACTTKVTVNKTVVIKGADGSTQSTTGTCTGSSCASGQNPDGNGDGFGDCTGDSCSKDEEGSFVLGPKTPELEKKDTYAETTQKFINRAKAAPLVSGLSGISMPSGGSCSIGSAQTWFGSIDFSSFCQLAPQVLAGLRYLFLAIWAWAAIRLFFTA